MFEAAEAADAATAATAIAAQNVLEEVKAAAAEGSTQTSGSGMAREAARQAAGLREGRF